MSKNTWVSPTLPDELKKKKKKTKKKTKKKKKNVIYLQNEQGTKGEESKLLVFIKSNPVFLRFVL